MDAEQLTLDDLDDDLGWDEWFRSLPRLCDDPPRAGSLTNDGPAQPRRPRRSKADPRPRRATAARRARLDGDAIGPAAGSDGRALDDGLDERPSLVEREQVPVAGRNGDGGRGGSLDSR